jgi:2'-5' RNA ligase
VSRIGVAIAIPQPYASELQHYRESFGDLRAKAIPTHVTLVPPTDIGGAVDLVTSHLADVAKRHTAFHLRMRGTATFRPVSPVVFINVTEGISACELLAEDARQGPLAQELTFPYHPHVTVAHDVDEEALDNAYEVLADYDRAFDVESFQLFIHDGVWRPVADYRLDTREPGGPGGGTRPPTGVWDGHG